MVNGCEIGTKFDGERFRATYVVREFDTHIVISDNKGNFLNLSRSETVYNISKMIMLWVYENDSTPTE